MKSRILPTSNHRFESSGKASLRARRRAVCQAVESLESRCLLSAVAWSPGINLPTTRADEAAVIYGGSILVLGGGSRTVYQLNSGSNSWSTAVSLDETRLWPGAAMTNGGLLVYGGSIGGSADSSILFYSPALADFPDGPSMSTARTHMAYTADGSGLAYAIGGTNGSGVKLSSAERFNGATWSAIASMPLALSGASAAYDGNGHIFVFGGATNSAAASTTVLRYTISTNTWNTMAPLPSAVTESAVVLGSDGNIYVLGGLDTGGAAQSSVQAYNPQTNTWSAATSLPGAVSDEAAVTDSVGRIEVIGGLNAAHAAVNTVSVSQQLNSPDSAPVITSNPVTQISSDGSYAYQVVASANPQASFSLLTAPTGMTIDPVTGLISWSAGSSILGDQSVTIQASNRAGGTTQSYIISISAPTITSSAPTKATATAAYSFTVKSTGNPTPTFNLTSAPSGMSIDPVTGLISWMPTAAQVGNQSVTVQVSNYVGQSSQTYTIPVVGLPPTGLKATGASTTSIRLDWNPSIDPTGVSGYNVYERTYTPQPKGSGGTFHYHLIAAGVPTNTYTVTGLKPSTAAGGGHTYVVTAVNSQTGLATAYSATASGQTLFAPSLWGVLWGGAVYGSPIPVAAGQSAQITILSYGNEPPTFSIVTAVDGMSVDPVTGVVTYNAPISASGLVGVTVTGTNSVGSASETVYFNVTPPLAYMVTNLNDSGPGSLRQAITDADAAGGSQTINFADSLTGSIELLSPLPDVTSSLLIQSPGFSTIAIDGSDSGNALIIEPGANLTLQDLSVSGDVTNNGSLDLEGYNLIGQIDGDGSLAIGTASAGSIAQLSGSGLTSTQSSLSIASGATLDIGSNTLVLNYGSQANDPIVAITADLGAGYAGGTWTGTGLTSSVAATSPTALTVGYVDGDRDTGTLAAPNQMVIALVLAGDANHDGVVNVADLSIVAGSFQKTGRTFSQGDFNFDSVVNQADLAILSANWGETFESALSALTPVPIITSVQPPPVVTSGVQPAFVLSGKVWNDNNGDGILNGKDAGLKNWRVFVDANKDGIWEAGETSAMTDSSGNYTLSDLQPDTYQICEAVPSGWRSTLPTSGQHTIKLSAGSVVTGKDFRNTQKSAISGSVFNDLNRDKQWNDNEAGLAGWRVFIDKNKDGILDDSETSVPTDANGNWAIDGLAAGTYSVRIVSKAHWTGTTPKHGAFTITLGSGLVVAGRLFGQAHKS